MPDTVLRLGTRGSALARAQVELVRAALEAAHPGLRVEPVFIRTTGDRLTRGPLPAGGKGLFVKEIDEALLAGAVDVGVHSMKDLPATLTAGIALGGVPPRADARDVLVSPSADGLAALPSGARVGTASVRRRAQLLARRRDLAVVHLRGNVDTRLGKWRDGTEVDALVLAAAGLVRLRVVEPAARPLPPEEFVPAVGQGALALVCRAGDVATRERLAGITDAAAMTATTAERAFLVAIGGDCNTPLAAHATVTGGQVAVCAWVSDPDGHRSLDETGSAPAAGAEALGRAIAERLLARGAGEILGR